MKLRAREDSFIYFFLNKPEGIFNILNLWLSVITIQTYNIDNDSHKLQLIIVFLCFL